MARLSLRKRLEDERGLALVEASIVMLLLLFITFGIMEYSWLFHRVQEMNSIARAGARQAVLPDSTLAEVQGAMNTLATGYGIAGYSTTVSPADITVLSSGDLITVTVEVAYANIELIGGALFPMPDPLRASVTMAKEGP